MDDVFGSVPLLDAAASPVDAGGTPRLPLGSKRLPQFSDASAGDVINLRKDRTDATRRRRGYRPESHKTEHHGHTRTIYVGPQAQAVLLPYLLRDTQTHCFSPAESEEERHKEQRNCRRTRAYNPASGTAGRSSTKRTPRTAYNKDSYQRAIARAIVKANKERTDAAADMGVEPMLLPHWHANQLRHSKATDVRRQFGLEAAQVVLGHAKADVTQVYAERDAALAMEVMRKIG